MATIWEEDDNTDTRISPTGLKSKVNRLTEELERLKMESADGKKQKSFKMPFRWKSTTRKAFRKINDNNILVLYLSAKGQLQPPKFYPLIGGNIIIIKNKAHEYIPSEVLFMKVGFRTVPLYLIREIDRKPVSNADWEAVNNRKDSTRNDEVLLKMFKLATIEKVKGQVNKAVWWALGIGVGALLVGYIIFA